MYKNNSHTAEQRVKSLDNSILNLWDSMYISYACVPSCMRVYIYSPNFFIRHVYSLFAVWESAFVIRRKLTSF